MSTEPRRAWKYLAGLMAGQAILYAVIAWLSFSFVYGEGFQQRPILLVMGLLAACFGLYATSLFVALCAGEGHRLTWLMYHWPEPGILGTRYDGRLFFDFAITWVEFGPWLTWLTSAALVRRLGNSSNTAFEERLCGRLHREAGDLPLEFRNHREHVNEIKES